MSSQTAFDHQSNWGAVPFSYGSSFPDQNSFIGNSNLISFSSPHQQPFQTNRYYPYQQRQRYIPQQPQVPQLLSFSDDEPLLSMETSHTQSTNRQAISIKTQTETLAISAAESPLRYPVLVSICAPSLEDPDGSGRTPIDLVTVLDVSGSMTGLKIDLVRRAVKFIIQNLGPADRLSIVSFSTTARRVFPLRRMSVEGRESATRAVDSLRPENMTNIVAGLEVATQNKNTRISGI